MKGDARHTLVLPFDNGYLDLPDAKSGGVFINAKLLPVGDIDWRKLLKCEQGQRSDFLALDAGGFQVEPHLDEGKFEFALVLCGRHKRLNQINIARAIDLSREGGIIVVAGDKTAGIAPLKKFTAQHVEISGSLSKHHAVAFWFANSGKFPFPEKHLCPDGYMTKPGMFSFEKPDTGSTLLASCFDKRIGGNVADFGSGWGYLARQVISRAGTIHHLDLYETDRASLEAAELNLADTGKTTRLSYFWHDLVGEKVTRNYDWIIMNPPFHSGRGAEPAIGQAFIKVAGRALRKGGKLLMVANRNLAYEAVLAREFSRFQSLSEDHGFKILEAVR